MLGAWLPLAMVVLVGAEGRESVHAVIWFLMPRKGAPDPIVPQPQLVFSKNRIIDLTTSNTVQGGTITTLPKLCLAGAGTLLALLMQAAAHLLHL